MPDMIEVIVARGRTVVVDDRSYGPGRKVRLPLADVSMLLTGGFIADPDGALVARFIAKPAPPAPRPPAEPRLVNMDMGGVRDQMPRLAHRPGY